MKLTWKNATEVFARILKLDKNTKKAVLSAFDSALDDLLDEDTFGTEGQLDPRGDRRS